MNGGDSPVTVAGRVFRVVITRGDLLQTRDQRCKQATLIDHSPATTQRQEKEGLQSRREDVSRIGTKTYFPASARSARFRDST
jgi:hypothetical protein